MIEATRRKLRQARFFYGHLVNQRNRRTGLSDPEAFRRHFAAFILVARSVLLALHFEEKEKWEAWEPGRRSKLTDEERKLLRFTNELRIDEAKRAGADPVMELEEVALHELLSTNLDVDPWPIAAPGVPPSTVSRPVYYFEHEDGKEEVTALCQRYLEFLEKVVNDYCAENYPASPQ